MGVTALMAAVVDEEAMEEVVVVVDGEAEAEVEATGCPILAAGSATSTGRTTRRPTSRKTSTLKTNGSVLAVIARSRSSDGRRRSRCVSSFSRLLWLSAHSDSTRSSSRCLGVRYR